MGNFSSKEAHVPPGIHAESFHTPPSSPQRDEAAFIPSVSPGAPTSPPPPLPALASSGKKPHSTTLGTPTKAPPPPTWRPPLPVATNAPSIKPGLASTVRGHASLGRNGAPPTSTPRTSVPVAPPPPFRSPPVEAKCSGSAPNPSQEAEEELEELLEDCRTTLGISTSCRGKTSKTTEILKHLLTEVKSLKNTLQSERDDWLQFQSDLQVAVLVADRLRAEADEELAALRTSRTETERELSAAQQRLKEADAQLASLRGELSDSRRKLTEEKQNPNSREGAQRGRERGGAELRSGNDGAKPESVGVAKRHLRNLTNEDRSGEEPRLGEVRRTWTSERSRSLSRLPASSDSLTTQNGSAQSNAAATAASTNKNLGLQRGHKSLERQDSKSNNDSGKREESLNKYNSVLTELPPTKSQDGFNLLLRRHGGSKRNSLLRWCQNRTQGYKNIEITNFSSSWADGLAFCALYHTYLPSHVHYSSLRPENKKENLSLAFRTGETVGIPQTLTMEEMQRGGGPDWQRVLGYVENVYRHFEM